MPMSVFLMNEKRVPKVPAPGWERASTVMECAASGGALAVSGYPEHSAPHPAKAASQPPQSKGEEPLANS
jgi:hypothetical protein